MPKYIFVVIYPLHFLFFRIFPKLPKIRHLYFVLTNGRNRVISKAEVFGRLNFSGYKITAENMIGNTLYFIAQKINTVSTEESPSYSPIVKLKRIGLNGEIITIHKFRTMHPYSEFIQKGLYEKQGLDSTGDKIIDEYRVTSWGKVIRKYWIDELPQLYDWLRGKITLVGVRCLSEAKYKLYPTDLQQKRIVFKPGLIPPYYSDLPKSFDEFMESERTYLKRKSENKYGTDYVYFFKACNNILFKGVRSS
jgi:lipopolysaccharide/colanic/teichoic acid biosynthesis glycosyltransferase